MRFSDYVADIVRTVHFSVHSWTRLMTRDDGSSFKTRRAVATKGWPLWAYHPHKQLTNTCKQKSAPWSGTSESADRRDDAPHICCRPGRSSADSNIPFRKPSHPCRCDLAMRPKHSSFPRTTRTPEIPPRTDSACWHLWKLDRQWQKSTQGGAWKVKHICLPGWAYKIQPKWDVNTRRPFFRVASNLSDMPTGR